MIRPTTKVCSIFGQIEAVIADMMVSEGSVTKIEPYDVPATVRYDDDGRICHCALVFSRDTEREFDRRVRWRRMPARLPKEGIECVVLSRETAEPVFNLVLYGVTMSDLCLIPMGPLTEGALTGGAIVQKALERRGLDPDRFVASPFMAWRLP